MGKRRKQREKPKDSRARSKSRRRPEIGLFPREKALLTSPEVAAALKITTRTLTNWSRGPRPRLPSVKIGKSRRWVVADVLRLIEDFKIAA
jgi:hypothetical protein